MTATATDTDGNTSEFSAPYACADADGDFICNSGDRDDDNDRVLDTAEGPCGADPLNAAVRPERTDGVFAGVSDDGDAQIDESLPTGSQGHDCDGDGYVGSTEGHVTTSDQDACGGDGWPSDLVSSQTNPNSLDLQDLASFVAPVRRFGSSPGHTNYSTRWDLVPNSGIGGAIDVQDIGAMITGLTGHPPMFDGHRAFGQRCPWPG